MNVVQDIFDTLNYLEIPWHEGPKNITEYEREFSQMHRAELYTIALKQLKESGALFACTCSRADVLKLNADSIYTGTCRDKRIPLDTENVSWRIRTDNDKEITVKTFPGEVYKTTLHASMTDFIVKRRDGFPAYQLISVIDDLFYGIDLVVRGQDLWPSTLAQLYLSSFLPKNNFQDTTFYHHSLLSDGLGNKLSKSEGATSIHYLRKEGKKPAVIYKLIAAALNIDAAPKSWQELVALTSHEHL